MAVNCSRIGWTNVCTLDASSLKLTNNANVNRSRVKCQTRFFSITVLLAGSPKYIVVDNKDGSTASLVGDPETGALSEIVSDVEAVLRSTAETS